MEGTKQTRPSFMTRLVGRGLKTADAKSWVGNNLVQIRIEDMRNPEDWTELEISLPLLQEWLTQQALEGW